MILLDDAVKMLRPYLVSAAIVAPFAVIELLTGIRLGLLLALGVLIYLNRATPTA